MAFLFMGGDGSTGLLSFKEEDKGCWSLQNLLSSKWDLISHTQVIPDSEIPRCIFSQEACFHGNLIFLCLPFSPHRCVKPYGAPASMAHLQGSWVLSCFMGHKESWKTKTQTIMFAVFISWLRAFCQESVFNSETFTKISQGKSLLHYLQPEKPQKST